MGRTFVLACNRGVAGSQRASRLDGLAVRGGPRERSELIRPRSRGPESAVKPPQALCTEIGPGLYDPDAQPPTMSTNQAEYYRGLEVASAALRHDQRPSRGAHADRAARVHEAIQPLLDQTEDHAQLACRLGCSHCCHYPVGVTYPEAMRLVAAVRLRPELIERIVDASSSKREQSWEQLVGAPCPLLLDHACAVHESRPMPCRALGSLDAEACAVALLTDRMPPRDEVAWWRGLGAAQALANSSPRGSRELRSAVSAILTAPAQDAERAFAGSRTVPGSD